MRKTEKSRNTAANSTREIPAAFLIFLFVAVFFIVVILLVLDANKNKPQSSPPVPFTVGGSAAFTAPNVFIDETSLFYLWETMTELTTKCNLTSPTVPLALGSYAATTASWQSAKDDLEATCDFYGLFSMEQRAGGALEGPLDFCYAYASVGFQIVQIYYNNTPPFDFLGQLITAYDIAYPLNMYWKRSVFEPYDVAADYLSQVNAYILAVQAFRTGGGSVQAPSIQTYQSAFCNKYFGQDNLNQYNSLFQPWLAFPFEGMIQKLADSAISNAMQQLLGPIDFTPGSDIKAVYALGAQYIGDDRIQLFTDAVLGGLDITVVTDPAIVALPAIKQSLYSGLNLNASLVPIFVFATFTDNPSFYSGFDAEGASIFLGFTENSNTQPQQILGLNLATAIQNTLGARLMSAMDFATTHPYEITFGPSYINEKFVADLITLCIGTQVTAQSTEASDIFSTFAIKNTVIYVSPSETLDIGGRLTQEQAQAAFFQEGASLGLQMPPFSITLTESTPLGGNLTAAAELLGATPPAPPPAKFDWRQVQPACIPPPIDQGNCNNCWAIASTRSISVRECIRNGGSMTFNQFMSVYHVTTCSNLPQGKNGCDAQQAGTGYTFMTGDVHTQQCMPTVLQGSSATGCQQACNPGTNGNLADVSGIVSGSYVRLDNPRDIKIALVNDGPLSVGFSVPTNFLQFFPKNTPNPNGVYRIDPEIYTLKTYGHMVTLWGYDDTAPVPYWLVQNSWGGVQGASGFLKLEQDRNGLLANSAMWPDKYAWTARPRARKTATDPSTILFQNMAQNNPAAAKAKPTVFTSQLGCPNLIVNTNQSTQQAGLQGCPNSAGSLTTDPVPVRTSGGNTISAACALYDMKKTNWSFGFVAFVLVLLMS